MKNIMFVASEGLPFIKSGGLADIMGSLPKALVEKGNQVAVVIPMYKKIIEKNPNLEWITNYDVHSGIIHKRADIYYALINDVRYYFIRQDYYFYRDEMYGYMDDGERFAFFCKAALDLILHIDFIPDVIHCNDWHTGMIPILGKKEYSNDYYHHVKYVYTIHNLKFQGEYSKDMLCCFNLSDYFFYNGDIEYRGNINFMKAGIMYADKVNTVSNQYRNEILSDEYGEGLNHVLQLRNNDLWGIVNGIDYDVWNPKTDKSLYTNYTVKSLNKRIENKLSLQKELGLNQDKDVMLVGIVSRLTLQKGFDLVVSKMEEMLQENVQFVILGSGDANFEHDFRYFEEKYKGRVCYWQGYNEDVSHKIYAAVDLFLMPSKFEPCGVSQLLAMHYGALPLVRETGGLKDTVIPYNEYQHTGDGFSFYNYSSDEMFNIFKYALYVYYNKKDDWKAMMKQAMNKDVSWENSCQLYLQLYDSMM